MLSYFLEHQNEGYEESACSNLESCFYTEPAAQWGFVVGECEGSSRCQISSWGKNINQRRRRVPFLGLNSITSPSIYFSSLWFHLGIDYSNASCDPRPMYSPVTFQEYSTEVHSPVLKMNTSFLPEMAQGFLTSTHYYWKFYTVNSLSFLTLPFLIAYSQ